MLFRRKLGNIPSVFGEASRSKSVLAWNSRLWSPKDASGLSLVPALFRSSSSGSSSGSGSGGSSYVATGPSQQLKSWESGARRVQNTRVENKYLEHIREVHDPSQHLKTIEDELKGAIGKALGKQGEKVLLYTRLMDQERRRYEDLLRERADGSTDVRLHECAVAHNDYRKEGLHARWELIVHRQAAGFIVGNHKFVQDKFPIGDALPVADIDGVDDNETANQGSGASPKKKTFTDQLDWWTRIGRWK